ncbi:isoaspartyl peptidase/L-asparaginase [Schleiferiaceae bacterium]|nr:isoaspartyl peptidase/L-asparaginase [Schleiferiaceae bacterium]
MRCYTTRLIMVFFLLLFSSIVYSQGQKNFHFQGSAIVIHGGAGGIEPKYYNEEQIAAYDSALQAVLKEGYGMLSTQANGLDVVVHCLTMLENDPRFNAGLGAVFNDQGEVELDASVMDGSTKMAGAVAGLKHIKNPAKLARAVMEETEHVLLIGEGAEAFATSKNHELVDNQYFLTPKRAAQCKRWKEMKKNGTVGVVVLDAKGNVYAGTSTGGMMGKKYGRVGDVPIIGAGTYADNNGAAVSCTGHGEYYIRNNVAFQVNARMQYQGLSLEESAHEVIFGVLNAEAGNGGLIAIDAKGNATWTFNSSGMFRGAAGVVDGGSVPEYFTEIFGDPSFVGNNFSK